MCAVMNGLALHGGLIPYGGTFLVFSDYARNALRLAALMGLRTIYVFSHDSIGLGEDGPTHQPIEHAATPAPDAQHGCLASVRHGRNRGGLGGGVAAQERPHRAPADSPERALSARGNPWTESPGAAMSSADAPGARAVIIATGSEVGIALEAQKQLAAAGMPVRRGFHALDQRFRPPGRGLPELCPACRTPKGSGRGGRQRLLAQVRRHRGRGGRHRPLRRIGPRRRPVQALRLYPRQRHQGRQEHRYNDQSSHQRIRTHRAHGSSRPLRGRQEAPASVRRGQRPRRRADQRPPAQVRHRPRQVPGERARRRRQHRGQQRPHQGGRRARPGQAAVAPARRRRGAGVHRPLHQQGESRRAPAGRRAQGDHLGAGREGRRPHRRVRRQPQDAEGRRHGDLQRLVHHQLPGAAGQGDRRPHRRGLAA